MSLSDATPGGTWSSSSPSIATIVAATGVVTGVSVGPTTITYTVGASFATYAITVVATPAPVTGLPHICMGGIIIYSDDSAGGTWASSSTSVVTIDPSSGIAYGAILGTAEIQYSLPTGCTAYIEVTVSAAPGIISGASSICAGTTTPFTIPASGGIWSSSDGTIASVAAATGIVGGISGGTATISYALPGGCAATRTITINPAPMLSSSLTPPAICDSGVFNYVPMSTTVGATFSWSRAFLSGITDPASSGLGNPNEQLINTTSTPIVVTYVYTLSGGGCSNIENVTVTVYPTPMLSSTLTPPAICDTTMFSYIPTSLTPGTTYAWNRPFVVGITPPTAFGAGSIHDMMSNTTTGSIVVTYIYRLSVSGCINGYTQAITVTVNPCSASLSAQHISEQSAGVTIFPNPSPGIFTIAGLNGDCDVAISDMLGRKVFSTCSLAMSQLTVDLSGRPSGLYFVTVVGGGNTYNSRILLAR